MGKQETEFIIEERDVVDGGVKEWRRRLGLDGEVSLFFKSILEPEQILRGANFLRREKSISDEEVTELGFKVKKVE